MTQYTQYSIYFYLAKTLFLYSCHTFFGNFYFYKNKQSCDLKKPEINMYLENNININLWS